MMNVSHVNLFRAYTATTKKSSKVFYSSLKESVANSLQAGATRFDIIIKDTRMIKDKLKIEGYTFIDDGEGFTKSNLQALDTLHTPNKEPLGCRGIGHLNWFTDSDTVSIMSDTGENLVTFGYSIKNNGIANKTIDDTTGIKKTSITIEKMSKVIDLNTEEIRRAIISHCWLLVQSIKIEFTVHLWLNDEKTPIYFEGNNNSFSILPAEGNTIEQKHTTITATNGQSITINYDIYSHVPFSNKTKAHEDKKIYLCIDKFPVINYSIKISDFLLRQCEPFIIFVHSDFLNSIADDSRTKFNFPDESDVIISMPNISEEIFLSKLKRNVVQTIADRDNINLKEEENNCLDAIKKSHPYLMEYINKDDLDSLPKTIIANADKKLFERKEKLLEETKKLLSKPLNTDKYNEEVVKKLTEIPYINQSFLSLYVLIRNQVLDFLEIGINNKQVESFFHDIFQPQNTVTDDTQNNILPANNFWILDDLFMSFKKSFSDEKILDIIPNDSKDALLEHQKKKRPDIVIFYDDDLPEYDNTCVIIEFKRPTNTDVYDKTKAIEQLYDYSKWIKKHYQQYKKFYTYAIVNFDDELIEKLTDHSFIEYNSKAGLIYHKYNEKTDVTLTVMDWETLLKNARNRNNVFLNILNFTNNE